MKYHPEKVTGFLAVYNSWLHLHVVYMIFLLFFKYSLGRMARCLSEFMSILFQTSFSTLLSNKSNVCIESMVTASCIKPRNQSVFFLFFVFEHFRNYFSLRTNWIQTKASRVYMELVRKTKKNHHSFNLVIQYFFFFNERGQERMARLVWAYMKATVTYVLCFRFNTRAL